MPTARAQKVEFTTRYFYSASLSTRPCVWISCYRRYSLVSNTSAPLGRWRHFQVYSDAQRTIEANK